MLSASYCWGLAPLFSPGADTQWLSVTVASISLCSEIQLVDCTLGGGHHLSNFGPKVPSMKPCPCTANALIMLPLLLFQVQTRGCMVFLLEVCRLLGLSECGLSSPSEKSLLRILTPLLKLYTAKQVSVSIK